MNRVPLTKDLIVVVADLDTEMAVKSLLMRHRALSIRPITFNVYPHVQRDPGCRIAAHSFLKPEVGKYDHALIVFDWEGAGAEDKSPEEIEVLVEELLSSSGWTNRCACVVIKPEFEMWVWSDSPHVPEVLGWKDRQPSIRTWIKNNTEYWPRDADKPDRPKEALAESLRVVRKSLSPSLFETLAGCVSVNRCTDRAFIKFKTVLANWFRV